MQSNQPKNTPPKKRFLKWVLGIGLAVVLICGGVPTLIYVFFVPSSIEMAIGQPLPDTAEVTNAAYDFSPIDPLHRFEIAFTDDQARDLLIAKWNLQSGAGDIMTTGASNVPSWWPSGRLDQIEESGECYGRVDDQMEQWWAIWVDRENNLLYFEAGDW